MILEVDIGNTFLKWRVIQGSRVLNRGRHLTADLAAVMPADWPDVVDEVRVASVAGPAVAESMMMYSQTRWQRTPLFAKTQSEAAGVVNSYAEPSRMGVDRWLVMLAAFNDCQSGCCVVDCGSAITVDYLSGNGVHQGGFIIPGLRLMSGSLLSDTAQVRVDRSVERFSLTPGCHTSEAVAHGINFAFKALQEKILNQLAASSESLALYITGGDGALFHELCGTGDYRPELVMDGLQWAVSEQ
ncbi:MAG: type III pantothenate kinase [Pontibacterium sp.]